MRATKVLQKCLGDALSSMHALRRCVLLRAVEAVIHGRRLTLIDLARSWPGAERIRAPKPGRRKLNALLPSVRTPRPSRTAQANRAAKRLFRHGLEAFAPKGTLLLQMLADGDQFVVADALFEPRSVGIGTFQWRTSHRNVAGVGCDQ